MKKIQNSILCVLAALLAVSCSEEYDEINAGDAPVLQRDPIVHIPGASESPEITPPDNGGETETPPEPSVPDIPPHNPVNPPIVIDRNPGSDGAYIDPDGKPQKPEGPEDPIDPNKPVHPDNPVGPSGPENPELADDAPIESMVNGIQVLPLTNAPYTTLQRTHMPTIGNDVYPVDEVKRLIASGDLKATDKKKYAKYGMLGKYTDGVPWGIREKLLRASDPPLAHKGKSIAYFWQVSDPQLVDAQSPCRMEAVVRAPYVVSSAYRAQGIYSTHMFDLHVQTARRFSDLSTRPFDFALVTGDITDNNQVNEQQWFERMMTGGVLNPDSGADDDPIPGPNNDFADPFYSHGLGNIPWYVAIGNHDMLYMGFTVINDAIRAACVGDEVIDLFEYMPVADAAHRDGYNNGFQDASDPDSPVRSFGTKTPADPNRRLRTKMQTLQDFYDAPGLPKGHGIDPEIMAKGWGYSAVYPIPGRPIKLITLDTNSGTFSEANMTAEQFKWLGEQLEIAREKSELVILQSHHGTKRMSGAITQDSFQKLVASYENVILHITGHGHSNDSNVFIANRRGYWEVMLASVVDYPSQSRIFEIVKEDNNIIDIYMTNIEPNAPKGSFVDTAISYASARRFFSLAKDPLADWKYERDHQNLILRTHIPEDVARNLDKYEWSTTIESERFQNLKFKASK